jgi:predicted nucleic acid-binding protein
MNAADVPTGPLLVDTDVFSIWYRRSNRHDEFGNLAEGHSPRVSAELAGRIRRALRLFVVLPFDDGVVERWAEIANPLRDVMKGKGVNDLWTAACALSYGLPLMTNNLGDFRKVSAAFPTLVLIHPDL